jgi:hypothetical protein
MRKSPLREARVAAAQRAERHELETQYKVKVLIEVASLMLDEVLLGMTPVNRAMIARILEPVLETLEERVTRLRNYARTKR